MICEKCKKEVPEGSTVCPECGSDLSYLKNTTPVSHFDGGLLQLIGWKWLGRIITLFTLGICYPWAVCMVKEWEVKHTTISGKQLFFDGNAVQLFGNYIKWFLLSIITCGIYGFWLGIKTKKWVVKHTHVVKGV